MRARDDEAVAARENGAGGAVLVAGEALEASHGVDVPKLDETILRGRDEARGVSRELHRVHETSMALEGAGVRMRNRVV